MARPITLCTAQWADMSIEQLAKKAASWGYDGLELACWGKHIDVEKAAKDKNYCKKILDTLKKHKLGLWAIAAHLVGQAVCDNIDERHKAILPDRVWGDGDPEGVRQRAAEEMKRTAEAAKNLGATVVNGFTGSSIWHLIYDFPPTPRDLIEKGFQDFADRWKPILDHFHSLGVRFALEVHPTEIAFDFWTAKMALEAIDYHPAFGFNFDPSHLQWQGVDPVQFIYEFGDRIFHVHLKDCKVRRDGRAGILSSMLVWGDPRRGWDFRSLGHGDVNFPEIIRALNAVGYQGPLSVEWEDVGMDREYGAAEACQRAKSWEFEASKVRFDEAFAKK